MPQLILLCFIFFSFPLAGCSAKTQNYLAPEQKKEELYVWDFGRVKQGQILKHEFILKNESLKTLLKVKKVNTSCGCTVSQVKKKELRPQEATTIEVKFNSEGYSGPLTQYIYVNTDSLDKPIIKYIIKADVM